MCAVCCPDSSDGRAADMLSVGKSFGLEAKCEVSIVMCKMGYT